MTDTIFSRIIRGEIPSHRVYQDDLVLAFLDINPLSKGHTLVIPKEPAATMADLSDDSAAALGRALPRICRAVMQATGAESYNLLQNNGEQAGQEVPHVHFHIIPRMPDADTSTGQGLRVTWKPTKPDDEELAKLGRMIARLL